MKIKKTAAFLALLLGMGLMAHAWSRLSEAERIYQEGNEIYEAISAQAKGSVAAGSRAWQTQPVNKEILPAADAHINIPGLSIDFEALKAINKNVAAWLYCPDTVIDYPILQADDYSYYINHLPDGTVNANGSLFIDYNNASDFSERLTVIYGHHMKSGRMFGNLKGYKNQEYYEHHPFMYLYTEQGNYQIELIYGCVIGAGQWRERAFMYAENIEALLAYAAHNTTFESDAVYTEGDRVIALSTCSYEFDDARYVVIGILGGES